MGGSGSYREWSAGNSYANRHMSASTLVLATFVVFYVLFTAYIYGRQRRWLGFLGWVTFMIGMLLAFGGGGDAFPWAGLLWACVSLFGIIMVAVDVATVRRGRDA